MFNEEITSNKIKKIPYRQEDHGTWWDEWQFHEGVSDWTYCTGICHEKNNFNHLIFVQYTLIFANHCPPETLNLHVAVTDITKKKKFATVHPVNIEVSGKGGTTIKTKNSTLILDPDPQNTRIDIVAQDDEEKYGYELHMRDSRGPDWHCDNGVECMGDPNDPESRTLYYSWMNMPTTGTVFYTDEDGRHEFEIEGPMWFDRQWGPYKNHTGRAMWEWFSFRMFNGDRFMIQCFPNAGYNDFTYHSYDGTIHDHFMAGWYKPEKYVFHNGIPFTINWTFHIPHIPGYDELYLRVFMEDHFHGATVIDYFEGPGEIFDKKGNLIGYFVAEQVPGARNCDVAEKKVDTSPLTLESRMGQIFAFPGLKKILENKLLENFGDDVGKQIYDGINTCYELIPTLTTEGIEKMTYGLLNAELLQEVFDEANAAYAASPETAAAAAVTPAAPAPAEVPAPAPSATPAVSAAEKVFDKKMKLKDVMKNEKACAIIEEYFPGMTTDPGLAPALNMPIKNVLAFIPGDEAPKQEMMKALEGLNG